jgi:hypothetical protein
MHQHFMKYPECNLVRSEVLTVVTMKITVFRDVTLCGLIEVNRRIGEVCSSHLQCSCADGLSRRIGSLTAPIPTAPLSPFIGFTLFTRSACFYPEGNFYQTAQSHILQNSMKRQWNQLNTTWGMKQTASVVRVPGYRSRGPGFDSRHYQIFWEVVGMKKGFTQPREYNWEPTWMEKYIGSGSRTPILTAVGILWADHVTVGTNFVEKRRSLGRYSSLED